MHRFKSSVLDCSWPFSLSRHCACSVVPSPSMSWHVLANFEEPAKAMATKGRSPRALRKSIVTVVCWWKLDWCWVDGDLMIPCRCDYWDEWMLELWWGNASLYSKSRYSNIMILTHPTLERWSCISSQGARELYLLLTSAENLSWGLIQVSIKYVEVIMH